MLRISGVLAFLPLLLPFVANAADGANPGDKPLSEILKPVAQHGTAVSAGLTRHRREVVVCERPGICTELYLDRVTGQGLRRDRERDLVPFPPRDAMPLARIVLSLEQRGLGGITDVEFDRRVWDVDLRNPQGRRAELKVDPFTADIVRCRGRACP